MKRAMLAGLAVAFLGFVAVAQAQDKPNPTGTWKWKQTGRGGNEQEITAKLKLDGDKLTGTVSGRQQDTEISDAKFKDGEISFSVVRERGGNKFVTKYSGKLDKDTIKGKIETERDGQTNKTDWEAKKEKA
jgi:hypothetical protein